MDRRIHDRHMTDFQVRLTEVAKPEVSVSGRSFDISDDGISVRLPVDFTPGSLVELNINDSKLFGVVTYSMPEGSSFRTGIDVWRVLIGRSELAEQLRATLKEKMPNQQTGILPLRPISVS